jgi:phage-related baseplate assembly protein
MASSPSSAVDLSRLPAPQIVEQLSYETIFTGMVADLRARGDFDAVVESDPAIKVLEVAAYRVLAYRPADKGEWVGRTRKSVEPQPAKADPDTRI